MMSSVMPSRKYSSSLAPLRFSKYSTATDFPAAPHRLQGPGWNRSHAFNFAGSERSFAALSAARLKIFLEQRVNDSFQLRGSRGFRRLAGMGARFKMASKFTAEVSPGKARRPVDISYRTAPKENKSLRMSTSCPRACSGGHVSDDAQRGSRTRQMLRSTGRSRMGRHSSRFTDRLALASPKSRILARPLLVMKRFAGLISRWIMPRACAVASALAIWIPNLRISSVSIGRPSMRC